MDTLETYPRDELFHTDVDELAADGRGGDERPRAARRCGCSCAATPTAATSRCSSTCPATATTPRVRERFAQILQDQLGGGLGRVHGRHQRVDHRPGALRGAHAPRAGRCPTSTRPSWSGAWPRRPAPGATTSSPPCIAEYGEEVGTLAGPPLRRRVARGLQGGLLRRAPPRSTWAGSSRSRGEEGIDLSLYEQLDAGRGEARLKVFRIGEPLSLSDGAADAVVDGRRGRRRAALRARRPRAPLPHLRVRAALRRRPCPPTPASCSRTRCARSGTATTRSTGSTRWSSAPG